MSDSFRVTDAPAPAEIPADPLSFLESLDGPTAWRVPGRDRSRVRVVTTLLHGNEPSGLLAMHEWLGAGPEPAVDVICVIANVEAAPAPKFSTHFTASTRPAKWPTKWLAGYPMMW